MPTGRPRILIADDHTLVADLCKKLLETEFDGVGVVSNGRALVQAARELKPDVIVVDIAMPILNGLDVVAPSCFSRSGYAQVSSARKRDHGMQIL